nr:MAG TPA: hypothetical protein [Caudoviricetes sp.]
MLLPYSIFRYLWFLPHYHHNGYGFNLISFKFFLLTHHNDSKT